MKNLELNIGHLYPNELNLYGDTGNIEALLARCSFYNIDAKIIKISKGKINVDKALREYDLLFMGGGPDSMQKEIYDDFVDNKGIFIKKFYEQKKPGLFVCGAFQLLGNYYKPYSGEPILGLSLFNFYTEHFGRDYPRCVGNVTVDISNSSIETKFSKYIVGFENHGGNTFLDKEVTPLGKIIKGFGNNRKEKSEGILQNNFIGTYLHGPVLPKNPHLTDFLISKALEIRYNYNLKTDYSECHFELKAHKKALKLRR